MATELHDRPVDDLLELVRSGDQSAATELHERYVGRLILLARSRLTPKHQRRVDPEDVVQSACRSFFRRVLDGRYHVADEEQLWHLLAAITVSKARKAVRRHTSAKRSVSSEESTAKSLAMANVDPIAVAQEPTPEEATILIEETERMMTCLTPLQRQIVQLHLQGLEAKEIGRNVQCSERTVHRAIERARNELVKGLQVADGN